MSTIEYTPNRKPELALAPSGRHYEAEGFAIDFESIELMEYYFIAPVEMISFIVGSPTHLAYAFDSDVLQREYGTNETMNFMHQGSTVYSREIPDKKHKGMRFLALSYHPGFRQRIEEEMDAKPTSMMSGMYKSGCSIKQKYLSESLQQFMSNGFQGGKFVAESLLTMSIVLAIETMYGVQTQKTIATPTLTKVTLNQTLEYIEANLEKNIGLREIAEVANLSSYHFSRCFKSAMGLSPYAYLLARRVERAKLLLKGTTDLLPDIALRCGFSSHSHLSTVFKRYVGLTPLAYRNQC